MNKALGIIEALVVDLDPKRLSPHPPQSIVHAIVENIDGSSLASLSSPIMVCILMVGIPR